MHIKFKTKVIVVIIIFATLNAIMAIGAIFMTNRINTSSREINATLKTLDRKIITTENLREALALFKQTSEQVEKYNQYFYRPGNEINLITDLEDIAAKNKVTQNIANTNFDNLVNSRINFTVTASGPLINLFKYIADLENYKYFLSLEKISLTPVGTIDATAGATMPANLSLNLSLYVHQ
ncbi:MAG: hypothetical protein PHD72_03905 [Patescibacteria group bacterium]|nr:hypothetical protein [Patescibacteria group bacterium]